MKITKFGHCALLIEENGTRILADPGTYSTIKDDVRDIDAILITHEHPDHIHLDLLQRLISNNPGVTVYTNSGVAKLLTDAQINFKLLENAAKTDIKGVSVEALGSTHATIYRTLPEIINTGYLIAGRLFYPGDSLNTPIKNVEILALPVAAPWLKLSEAIDYALTVKPKICFPVHDGILKVLGSTNVVPVAPLKSAKIVYQPLEIGQEYNFN